MGPPRGRLLRERSRLSILTDAGSSEASSQGNGCNWEQELLQLQIASSALINPLGNIESAPIADSRIIAEVTHQTRQTQVRADSRTSDGGRTSSPSGSENRSQRGSLDLQEPGGDAGPAHSSSGSVAGDVTRGHRTVASPFFAAAQQHVSPATPADERPLRAPPPPLLTAFGLQEDAGSPVYAGLALQRQTEVAEIILPQSSSSSLNSSPTLPYHPLTTFPLSPQSTAKGFVTADSFKHEPGHTLLDCTDPTPKNSLDLDDANLKKRLAQLLPPFPLPSKPVRRNLSHQMCGLESLSEVPDGDDIGSRPRASQQLSPPGPSSGKGDSSDEGTSEAKTTRSQAPPTAARTRLRLSETGSVCEKEASQTGDVLLLDWFSKAACKDL